MEAAKHAQPFHLTTCLPINVSLFPITDYKIVCKMTDMLLYKDRHKGWVFVPGYCDGYYVAADVCFIIAQFYNFCYAILLLET